MKTTFNKVMQVAVAAAALTFATASYAAADVYTHPTTSEDAIYVDSHTSSYFKNVSIDENTLQIGVSVWDMYNVNNTSQRYYAFCVQPMIDFNSKATYTATYNFTPSTDVQRLYESSFAGTVGNSDKQIAFQLALWELQNDDKNLTTGNMHFALNDPANPQIDMAASMLTAAASYQLGTSHYKYVVFNGEFNGNPSQQLLGVSAVPEADTWAMMAVGLGLVGLVSRRKQKNEKFA